ncbi:MAG: YfaZ family outer membrane protein [Pseudomonadota bacterium]
MLLRRILALCLFAFSSTALADSVDLNLRDTSVQVQYNASMGKDTLGRSELHAGFLYTSNNNSLFDFGLLVQDELAGAPGVTVGVGLKGLIAKTKINNARALALGAMVRFAPFTDTRFGISGQVYLSPNIVTFGDADRYTETGLKLDYEVIPQAVAYIGYRKIKLGLTVPPDEILDEGVNIGVKISF